jgi:16S rRNA (guanine966-N2)-methyltransferase
LAARAKDDAPRALDEFPSAMRIVAGKFRGARIEAPKGLATRPTSDRVRQALFNVLEHGAPRFDFEGARVLDLFAGSGALGLEACSRGARFCLFVEDSAEARGAIRRNVEALELTGVTKIWRRDATKLGDRGANLPFDLIFLDPPYGRGLGDQALAALVDGGWLGDDAVVVVEERADAEIILPAAFQEIDTRSYGDTKIVMARETIKRGSPGPL